MDRDPPSGVSGSPPKFYDVWRTFQETTTAHGIPHVSRAKGPIKKTFWSAMLVATLAFLAYNITEITMHFFDYPVTVNIQLLHRSQMVFPAVTICNMNPVRKSAWEAAMLEVAGLTGTVSGSSKRKRKKRATEDTCPVGWEAYNGYCYTVDHDVTNYSVAEQHCQSEDAYVIDVVTQDTQDFITDTWTSENSSLWIGLGFDWFWVTGDRLVDVGFTNWADDEPSGGGFCAHTAYLGTWKDRRCQGTRPYVCEKPVYSNGSCDGGAVLYNSTCYLKSNDSLSVPDAKQACLDLGAHLVTIETQGEQDLITNFTYDFAFKFWIGLELLSRWRSGDNDTYRNWAAGEPTDAAALCVILNPEDGKWRAMNCADNSTKGVLCKKKVAVPKSDEPTCCCTCCYHDDDGTVKSCGTCGSGCLANSLAVLLNDTTPVPAPLPDPEPIPGSKYPERPQTRESYQETEAVTETLAELPLTQKEDLGYKAEDFIVDCQFAGATCPMANFERFYNPVHGNCFIFNSGWNDSQRLYESYKTGRRHGLQLILNIDQDEYIKETGDTAGARLVVHTQNSMPFPEDEGITVTPGQATSIGIRQLKIKRLPQPFGDCLTTKEKNATRNAYQLLFPVSYRPTACSKTCYQHNVIAECHCKDPYYPINDDAYGARNLTICRTANVTQDDCRYEVTKKFERNELECYCPNACDEVIFVLSPSTAEWPSDVQKASVLSRFYSKAPSLFADPTDPEKYKRNLLKVEVFYEEFNFEMMQEKEAYYTGNYLSDLGGVLGLWLGCSILTLVEFLELIMDVLAVCVMRNRCRKPCTSKAPSTTANAVKVAPSPSPVDNCGYAGDKTRLDTNYFISGSSKFDIDLSQLPKAFQSYIEETRLELAEKEKAKRKKRANKKL